MTLTLHNDRILSIDALRGFALAGIVFAHFIEQYTGGPIANNTEYGEPYLMDQIVGAVSFVLISGKFFSIFSLLFGISFTIMMDNAAAKGSNFSLRFVWRLVLLFVIGFVHSLVYRGDILTVYVVIGLILPLFYHLHDKWLWALAILFIGGLGKALFFGLTGDTSISGIEMSDESPSAILYLEQIRSGSILEVARGNFTIGLIQKADFQFGIFGRGYITFGYFLMGIWVSRMNIFGNLALYQPKIKKSMWWSLGLAIGCIGLTVAAFSQLPQPLNFASWGAIGGLTLMDWANCMLTVFIIAGFLLLFNKNPKGMLSHFIPYGKMALTNYIMQSLIGTFIFFDWGLGMLGKIHPSYIFLGCFGILYLQMQLSKYWLMKFQYGPLEWLWRSATFFQWMPFRKIRQDG